MQRAKREPDAKRIVPDVAVSGANGSTGLVDGLIGIMLKQQNGHADHVAS